MTDLVFHFGGRLRTQWVGGVPFHFSAAAAPIITLTIAGMLAPLSGQINLGQTILLVAQGTFAPLGGLLAISYLANVWAPLTVGSIESFHETNLLTRDHPITLELGLSLTAGIQDQFQAGNAMDALTTVPLNNPLVLDHWAGDRYRETEVLDSSVQDGFRPMTPLNAWAGDRWRDGILFSAMGSSDCRQAAPLDLADGFRIHRALTLDIFRLASAGDGGALDIPFRSAWREADLLVALSVPFPIAPAPGPGREQNLEFHFGWIIRPKLTFHFPADRRTFLIIPIREFYRVIPDAKLVRLPDRTEIPLESFTVNVDIGLSLHGLTAAIIGREAFERLTAVVGVQVELSAQGYVWRFLVNRLSGSQKFGNESYALEAMSLARALGRGRIAPRSYVETQAKTLQQLAEQELNFSGWTLHWAAPTWTIPGGNWSYDRLTPLEAIQSLAEAAGSYVHAGQMEQSLSVKPRYKVLPWHLAVATPDVILPADPVEILSFESAPMEDYTAVYVHGTTTDRKAAHVIIADSGGLVVPDAPQTHALLTHYDGLQAFGARFLAEHQSNTRWTLTLPLTPADGDIPLLDIGQVIQFSGAGYLWRGIVEGVRVGMSGIDLTQTIEVVTYGYTG